jgi:hypothetical protein
MKAVVPNFRNDICICLELEKKTIKKLRLADLRAEI